MPNNINYKQLKNFCIITVIVYVHAYAYHKSEMGHGSPDHK